MESTSVSLASMAVVWATQIVIMLALMLHDLATNSPSTCVAQGSAATAQASTATSLRSSLLSWQSSKNAKKTSMNGHGYCAVGLVSLMGSCCQRQLPRQSCRSSSAPSNRACQVRNRVKSRPGKRRFSPVNIPSLCSRLTEVTSTKLVRTFPVQPDCHLSSPGLARCSLCDLKENLWLCLICGALGCGRPQFGGFGGNGHALAHFESTMHPVAVKLGTITPEGSAGIFAPFRAT